MPSRCSIVGCTNNSAKDAVKGEFRRYFSIPAVKKNESEDVRQTLETRRREWIKQINRKGLTVDSILPHHKVCSDHFITGKPAYEMFTTDPDWIPTQKLGYSAKAPSNRGSRLVARQKRLKTEDSSSSRSDSQVKKRQNRGTEVQGTVCFEFDEDHPLENDSQEKLQVKNSGRHVPFFVKGSIHSGSSNVNACSVGVQTDLTSDMIQLNDSEMNRLLVENLELRNAMEETKYNKESFERDDEKVKFFTGLQTFTALMILVEYLQPYLMCGPRHALTGFEVVILTFMRLRFNLPFQLLGYLFSVGRTTASSYFHNTLNVMYYRMKPLIIWPEREELRKTQPNDFKNVCGGRIAVIIDCFEIFIDTPSDLLAKAQTFSSYKHHNTAKYLIGITPAGCISYISHAWGGRASDKHITDKSDFVLKLLPGDVVLADRGFDIAELVAVMQAEVKVPAFTKGKPQLSAFDVESSRSIAHVRIHVERVIGTITGKYAVLNGVMPLEMLSTREGEGVCTLDKLVTVCCALVNFCESVVPCK